MWRHYFRIALLIAIAFAGAARAPSSVEADETSAAEDKPAVEARSKYPWFLTLLGGQYSGSQLLEIPARLDLKDSWTVGLSVTKQFAHWTRFMRWEGELEVLKHVGDQDHWELTGSVNLRWVVFPWEDYVETTAAFGGGVSWASEVPALEKGDSTNSTTNQWLNYLMIELTAAVPDSHWSLVTRIHHRSGVFGLFGHSGSNVLEAGVRYRF